MWQRVRHDWGDEQQQNQEKNVIYTYTYICAALSVSPSQWKETMQICELTKVYVLREPINMHVVKKRGKSMAENNFKRDNGDYSPN